MGLKNSLEREFRKVFPVVTAKNAKQKLKVRGGQSIVLCREFRFLFGNKQCGYCIMTHQEVSLLMDWQRKRINAGRIERNNLKLRYLAELIHIRKERVLDRTGELSY